MTLRSDLLARGYLPENLPPVFTSASFGNISTATNLLADYITEPTDRTRPATYNATKRGHQRRLFAIPHPIAAADTSLFLSSHWNSITSRLSKSPFSISNPIEDPSEARALAITPHSEIALIKSQRLAASRYVVRTDISRFFPSIYTHALPWSFHGKAPSKRDHRVDSERIFFNRLDFVLRQAQDGQTVGIPIGPDSSRVIAEIIATAVDLEFANRLASNPPPMVRHVDDIWIGARTRDEAEHFLYTYRSCLRDYELDINELKTSVVSSKEDLAPFWPLELGRLLRHGFAEEVDPHNALCVLDRVFEYASREKDDGIIKFTLRQLDGMHAWSSCWRVLHPFLMKCVVNYPHSIDYVARVLAWRERVEEDIDRDAWGSILNDFISFHGRLANDSEVCWALWLASELDVRVQAGPARSVLDRCGPLPLILLFGGVENDRVNLTARSADVVGRLGENPFAGPFWIFTYEAGLRKWIRGLRKGEQVST